MISINEIIKTAESLRTSDIHIAKGLPVKLRIDGKLVSAGDRILTHEDCMSLAGQLTPLYKTIADIGELDFAYSTPDGIRCRVNLFHERESLAAAIRLLSKNIPSCEKLGLPPVIKKLTLAKTGIVFVTGQTGSGKSTTLAYLIDEINRTQCKHIITLEEPIEYIHESKQCIVSQREVGTDTRSLADGMKAVLREDPDVIMIGEVRTMEEIETALTIAETGHLVFASVHTSSAAETIDRIVDVFPPIQQQQIRMQLSLSLNGVICQQLLPRLGGNGRVLAAEIMMVNGAIRNLIREGNTPQIENAIATSADLGGCLMDNNLIALYRQGKIAKEEMLRSAHNYDYVSRLVR